MPHMVDMLRTAIREKKLVAVKTTGEWERVKNPWLTGVENTTFDYEVGQERRIVPASSVTGISVRIVRKGKTHFTEWKKDFQKSRS